MGLTFLFRLKKLKSQIHMDLSYMNRSSIIDDKPTVESHKSNHHHHVHAFHFNMVAVVKQLTTDMIDKVAVVRHYF